jgi:glycosyltransferase involved in cell wall biosynthesis
MAETIAVVIPTIKGRERLLDRALSSVARQHRQPDQIVVEPDPDRTGAAATRNRALDRVECDLVAFLDDDDSLLRNHLGALEFALGDFDLAYPTPRMVGGPDPTAVTVRGVWRKPWGVPFRAEQEHHLRTRGSFIPMTHLARVETVRRAGGFPEGVTLPDGRYSGEDERYLVAMLDVGARFIHLNVVTWRWHVWGGNTAGLPSPTL